MPPSTQAQINELKAQLDAIQSKAEDLERRQDVADLMRADTHKMMAEFHQALMVPQPGQGGRSLLERMATVTVAIETGDRAAESLVKWVKRLVVIGAILVALGGFLVKIEFWKGPTQ